MPAAGTCSRTSICSAQYITITTSLSARISPERGERRSRQPAVPWGEPPSPPVHAIQYVTVTVAVTVISPGWMGVDAAPDMESAIA